MIVLNSIIYQDIDIGNIVIEKHQNGEEIKKYIYIVQKLTNEKIESNIFLEIDVDKLKCDDTKKQYIKEYQEYIKWYKELEVGTYIAFLPIYFSSFRSKIKNYYNLNITSNNQVSLHNWGSFVRYSFINNNATFFKLPNIINKQQIKNYIRTLCLSSNIKPLYLCGYEGKYIG